MAPVHERICNYCGIIGIAFGVTCIIQHFIMYADHWMTWALGLLYVVNITAFALLLKKSRFAPVVILSSAVLMLLYVFFLVYLLLFEGILLFSLIVLMTAGYTIVMAIVIYAGNMRKRLQALAADERKEADFWNGKI